MEKVTVKSLYRDKEKFIDQEVEISGWIKKIRVQKNFGFIEINDGSFFKGIQIVFDTKLNNFDEISRLSIIS
ncbi:MAG: asparagine--tRNA ligase, partial [Fusobacterium varium]